MAVLSVLLAFLLGAFLGKLIAMVSHYLPPILFEGGEKGREPRDIFRWYLQTPICPSCHSRFTWLESLPLIGYVLNKGKCPHCHRSLELDTFPLEFAIALLFGVTALFFPLTTPVLLVLLANCLLICCFLTDFKEGILPDQLTQSLVWLGLIGSLYPAFLIPEESILGAVSGYGIFWFYNELYRYLRGKEGMYPGDFKLNAGIGAWVGFYPLLYILGISVILMIIGSLIQFVYSHKTLDSNYLRKEIAYGCYSTVVTQITLYFLLFRHFFI